VVFPSGTYNWGFGGFQNQNYAVFAGINELWIYAYGATWTNVNGPHDGLVLGALSPDLQYKGIVTQSPYTCYEAANLLNFALTVGRRLPTQRFSLTCAHKSSSSIA
jgi:hypothetical protein